MRVDIADAAAKQLLGAYELHDFQVGRVLCSRQVLQQRQHLLPLPQIAKRKLTDDEGMRQHLRSIKQRG